MRRTIYTILDRLWKFKAWLRYQVDLWRLYKWLLLYIFFPFLRPLSITRRDYTIRHAPAVLPRNSAHCHYVQHILWYALRLLLLLSFCSLLFARGFKGRCKWIWLWDKDIRDNQIRFISLSGFVCGICRMNSRMLNLVFFRGPFGYV